MKSKLFKSGFALPLLAFLILVCYANKSFSQTVATGTITYQTFYDDLSPYGAWIDYPGYGNVWSPSGIDDFSPYVTNGNWVYSDAGWAWESGYDWGWAPFHYGRWFYDDNYGWLWVPGYVWSPAWVTWGSFGDDFCWAPLLPDVYAGAQFGSWRAPAFYWNFCDRAHIYDRNLSGFVQRGGAHINDVGRISIINNFKMTRHHNQYYSGGPELNEVERYTKDRISTVSIKDVHQKGRSTHVGNTLNVYRPTVQSREPMPSQYRSVEPEKIKPIFHDEQPRVQRQAQQQNIRQLPVQRNPVPNSGGRPGRR